MKRQRFMAIPIAVVIVIMFGARANSAEVEHDYAIAQSQIPQYIADAVNSPARPDADHKLDQSRKPEQLLAFFGIKPGMNVADVWAGGGYTTELLARTVRPVAARFIHKIWGPPRGSKRPRKCGRRESKKPGCPTWSRLRSRLTRPTCCRYHRVLSTPLSSI